MTESPTAVTWLAKNPAAGAGSGGDVVGPGSVEVPVTIVVELDEDVEAGAVPGVAPRRELEVAFVAVAGALSS
jgi:hypothetical protein